MGENRSRFFTRNRAVTRVSKDGVVLYELNPILCWHIQRGIIDIHIRGHYGIMVLWGSVVGDWSRIRKKYIKIGKLIICLNYGECAPYNPNTGKK